MKRLSMILEEASKLKTPKEKANYLKNNESEQLKGILKVMFDDNIKLLLPPGSPPYKPNRFDEEADEMLYSRWRTMYMYLDSAAAQSMNQTRREMAFIELLETIHSEDAKLIIAMKDGECPYPTIHRTLIKKAFPGLL